MPYTDPERLRAIKTLPQLLAYLRDELDWPIEAGELDELTFEWGADQLLVSDSQARRLTDGVVRQLRPLAAGQSWGIFVVEFADETFRRGALREILRGLVANRRRNPTLPAWQHENLLFICATRDYDKITFAHYRGEKAQKARLALFGWQCGSSYLRTLCEFNLPALRWPEDVADTSAWLKQWASAFDKEPLTKEFYREISNWYFWAREHAVFPDHPSNTDADGKPSLPLIRLPTRLIFCWFLREKRNPQTGTGMIPDALFDFRQIKNLLKDPSPESCTYYTAILQNLFFATLNTEMDKPGQPPARRFLDEGDGQRSDEHMVHQLWRHARQLRDPTILEKLLREIPFLNGGLFECLDDRAQKVNSSYTVEVRIDGFATDPNKQPKLPNFLFYGAPQATDLSKAYGDSSRCRETVCPLLDILNRYNFTLSENTPFDQEVALDPELLGHVFENLLAAYNPETGVVARKATGSFYTPRVVVDWMVDQAIDPKEENYGILPLPNLETKVVAANTLLGLQRGQLLLGSDNVRQLEKQLQQIRHNYFTARSYKRKKELRKEDKRLCDELATALADSHECMPYDAKRLAGWNPYDTNTHAPFFDPGWMFGLASKDHDGVFDVVIGNPPYVRQEELKNQIVIGSNGKKQSLKDALEDRYECFTGTADLYVYFFERSLQLLRIGGVLSFITSNKYFRASYGERLRTYLAYATQPNVVLDFGDAPVFTSIAYPAILVTQKVKSIDKGQLPDPSSPMGFLHPKNAPPQDRHSRVMTWTPGPDVREFPDIFERDAFALAQRDLKPDGWRMESPISMRLLERMRKAGTPLGEYVKGRLYRGITTGFNEAFVVDQATRDRMIADHPSSEEVLKPFLRGRDIKRWRYESPNMWFLFIPWHFPLQSDHSISGASTKAERMFSKNYPAVFEHLSKFKKQLSARNTDETGIRYEWYALQRCAAEYWQEFEQPKIVFPDIAPSAQFAWDESNHFTGNTSYILIASTWMLSILNSSAVLWIYRNISNSIRGGYLRFIGQYVEQIPIPPTAPTQQALCERLAEALIWLHSPASKMVKDTSSGLMIAYLEQWLNGLVYELFFPGELHARKLKLFDETEKLNPPDLTKISDSRKLATLQELMDSTQVRLFAMLVDLQKVEEVRIIEDITVEQGGQP